MSRTLKFWITGILVAAIGLVMARVIAPFFASQPKFQLGVFLIGVVVAMAGLGIILLGIRKK
jgi:hypothetical protein